MTRSLLAHATLVALAWAAPLAAQARGLPIDNSGTPRGLGTYVTVASVTDDMGGGWATGITGKLGLGRLGFTATASIYDTKDGGFIGTTSSPQLSVGGTINYRFLGGPLVPLSVTVQGGVGVASPTNGSNSVNGRYGIPFDEIVTHAGFGIAYTFAREVLAIKPWISPRLTISGLSAAPPYGTNAYDWSAAVGLSAGADFNFINGLGFHLIADMPRTDRTKFSFGAGIHYQFKLAGR